MADALGSVIVIISALIMWFLPIEDEEGQPIEANQWTMYVTISTTTNYPPPPNPLTTPPLTPGTWTQASPSSWFCSS